MSNPIVTESVDEQRLTLTITGIPRDASPASLARLGEFLGLEANGPDGNPSPRAWMRAGISASAIIRTVYKGEMSMDMLVASIAGSCDPDHDTSTPQREALISGHRSVEHEWATGETDGPEVGAVAATDPAEIGRRWLADSSLKEWFPLTAERLETVEAELGGLRASLREARSVLEMLDGRLVERQRERDEARAEVARLRARVRVEAGDVERAGDTTVDQLQPGDWFVYTGDRDGRRYNVITIEDSASAGRKRIVTLDTDGRERTHTPHVELVIRKLAKTALSPLAIEARHVAVLLAPDEPRLNTVDMPECLGRWTKAASVPFARPPTIGMAGRGPRARPRRTVAAWRFVLSERGLEVAAATKRLSDAANESMREYLQGEHANCFPGAFRDGFARGAAWARAKQGGSP